jgi:hypothetical protein
MQRLAARLHREKTTVAAKSTAKADVDAFLRDLKHKRKDDIQAIRAIVRTADKKLVERIKWNAPSYGYDDDRVTFRLQPKDVVQLIFHRGAKKRTDAFVFNDDTGLFEWLADDRAAVTFKDQADIRAKKTKLTSLVKSWMEATC